MSSFHDLLVAAAGRAAAYREAAPEARVYPDVDVEGVRQALGGLPDGPSSPEEVIDHLVDAVEPALVATAGPRYFGFVVGGALPAATAADMLAVGWDQPAFNAVTSPGAAVLEEVAGDWLKDLLGLPAGASCGFVTGGQAANTVALAAARHRVLAAVGWDVERRGLVGAPAVRVVANGERHATVDRALRLLGFGTEVLEPVATDDQGAIDLGDLRRVLSTAPPGGSPTTPPGGTPPASMAPPPRAKNAVAVPTPVIVCLQAGNVNTGAFDDLAAATAVAHEHGAWVHVDGAFGLWAAASPTTRHLVAGIATADSWATDGHKWLNVPYDCGYAFCAHPEDHVASMAFTAAYLTGHGGGGLRAPSDYVPESSRRARGVATWAALRQLGRQGVADLVARCCALARQFARQLSSLDGVTVANEVVLNQVLVRFGDDDAWTEEIVAAVQRSGECWMGATTWHGRRHMRISVSNWSTTATDVDRSVKAIMSAMGATR